MYKAKGLFTLKSDEFIAKKHFFNGLEYQAQTESDGVTIMIVTDRPEYDGNPIKYVSDIIGQPMCRAAY